MILYQREKIDNAIAYFAEGFQKRRGYYPHQMWIYKFLAFLDFGILKKTGTPSLGLDFDAMKMGPVPTQIYEKRDCACSETYQFERDQKGHYIIKPKASPDLDLFSDNELDEMDRILDTYTKDSVTLQALIASSHEHIRAWQIAWDQAQQLGKGKMPMDFADTFENLKNKSQEELTPEEERFLCYRDMAALEREEELETLFQ